MAYIDGSQVGSVTSTILPNGKAGILIHCEQDETQNCNAIDNFKVTALQ
jgi:hypothetical protein